MENRKSSAPRLLVAIVDRDKGNIIADLCSGQKLELNFGCIGFGTARSELLSMLGLGSRDKAVVFSITPPGLVPGGHKPAHGHTQPGTRHCLYPAPCGSKFPC